MNVFSPALHLDDGNADVDPEGAVRDEESPHVTYGHCRIYST